MQWYETIFELIDMRSFSNLWYWVGLSVFWSSLSHWVLGVPYDMLRRGQRQGGSAHDDVLDLVRINVGRVLFIARMSGLWILASLFFGLSALVTLAVAYRVEFAQALLCMVLPMCLVGVLTLRTALQIETQGISAPDLYRRLLRHRVAVQVVGMVSIFVTALFGMYQNMQIGVFG